MSYAIIHDAQTPVHTHLQTYVTFVKTHTNRNAIERTPHTHTTETRTLTRTKHEHIHDYRDINTCSPHSVRVCGCAYESSCWSTSINLYSSHVKECE